MHAKETTPVNTARTAPRSNDKAAPYMLALLAGALAFSAGSQVQARKPAASVSSEDIGVSIADKLFDRFVAPRR